MASSVPSKKMTVEFELPECPVCMETMRPPIYQCLKGHSLCSNCTSNVTSCPICRQDMTTIRNLKLEEFISKAKIECPNSIVGCIYKMAAGDMDDHLTECIFREMRCPIGKTFGKCCWTGKLKEIVNHCKDNHADHLLLNTDNNIEFEDIDLSKDDCRVHLISWKQFVFVYTMKLNSIKKMIYWTVQMIAGKKIAKMHIYELELKSLVDKQRKITFTEYCSSDSVKSDEIIEKGNCGMLSLNAMTNFVTSKKICSRLSIRKVQFDNKKNKEKNDHGDDKNKQLSNNSNDNQSSSGQQNTNKKKIKSKQNFNKKPASNEQS